MFREEKRSSVELDRYFNIVSGISNSCQHLSRAFKDYFRFMQRCNIYLFPNHVSGFQDDVPFAWAYVGVCRCAGSTEKDEDVS